jgi:hypothetical protein
VRLAVSNAYGVWFEIQLGSGNCYAIRKARASLQLKDWPLDGISLAAIEGSSEPLPSQMMKYSSSPQRDNAETAPTRPTDPRSSTARGRKSGKGRDPRGDGDDPFTLGDLDKEDEGENTRRLEGTPPTKFDGDRSKTVNFLISFKRFIRLNKYASISQDPFRRCAYFLSLIEGPNVEGWLMAQDEWLDKVERDSSILPLYMTEWDVMEQEFRKAFIDYAVQERAAEELTKLKMKDGNIDEYISQFRKLALRSHQNVDEPAVMKIFALGLPSKLSDTCLDLHNPDNFDAWCIAAQRNHTVWMKKQAMRGVYNPTQPRTTQNANSQRGEFFWRRGNQRGGNTGQRQGQGSGSYRNNPRNSAPFDPNAMDTSATVRRVLTEEDKTRFMREGRCFRCARLGHISSLCPERREQPARAKAAVEEPTPKSPPSYAKVEESTDHGDAEALAAKALSLSDDAMAAFVKKMVASGHEMGFLDA